MRPPDHWPTANPRTVATPGETMRALALLLVACSVRAVTPQPPSPGVPLSVFHVDTLVSDCEPWWLRPATLCKGLNVSLEHDGCRWRCKW